MEEQHNLDLESSVNSENSTESESFNFLPLGIIFYFFHLKQFYVKNI